MPGQYEDGWFQAGCRAISIMSDLVRCFFLISVSLAKTEKCCVGLAPKIWRREPSYMGGKPECFRVTLPLAAFVYSVVSCLWYVLILF